MKPGKADALLIIDVQNDFIDGSLAVSGSHEIVPVINRISALFETRVITRDWHPTNHVSFSDKPRMMDGSWPPHCVQNTRGAEFHPDLVVRAEDHIENLGDEPQEENYSGFHGTNLEEWLHQRGIHRIFLTGIATEYCVFTTATDGLVAGFQVCVIEDAIAGVNVPPGSAAKTLNALRQSGAQIVNSDKLSF